MFSAKDVGRCTLSSGTGAAMFGVTAGYAVARLTGQQLLVVAGGRGLRSVPLGAILVATVVGAGAAHGLARLAASNARPRRMFALLAGVGLLLSAVPPVQSAADVGTAVWLLVLHAVVAGSVLPPAAKALPEQRSPLRSPDSVGVGRAD